MQELLYEETVQCTNIKSEKIKYNLLLLLGVLSFFLAVVWVFVIIYFMNINGNWLLNLIFHLIPLAIFIATGIFLFKLKNKFCVDYDYIFVSGSIRISKVINNSIRQTIYRFNCSQLEKIGPVNSDLFNQFISQPGARLKYLTSNNTPAENKSFYYFKLNYNSVNTILVLECSKVFMVNVLKFSKMSIRDTDLK
ncbi:MAG: hypothetical protein IKB98_04905 [Clostridia bacterium]|nr:hypothetical protein [Clostridia bacterium]